MKLFVAVMGASSYIFAQADPSEQIAKRRLEIDAIAPRPPYALARSFAPSTVEMSCGFLRAP